MPLDLPDSESDLSRLLVDNSHQGLLVLLDERIIFVNKAVSGVSGYTPEELKSFSLNDLMSIVHPEDQERVFSSIGNLIAENLLPVRQEFRIIRKDGAIRWVDTMASCIEYRGRPTLQLAYLDITDKKRTEMTLRDSKERYKAFIANSSEGIYRLESSQSMPITLSEDDQVRFILEHAYIAECNDAFAQIYGLTKAEELVGKKVSDFLTPDPHNIETIRAFIRSSYRLADAESYEIDKNGNIHVISSSLIGIVENGFLIRAWGTQHDITDRKRAEEALRESEEKYHTAIDFTYDCETWLSPEGNYVYVSPSCERLTGYSIDEFLRDPELLEKIVDPDDKKIYPRHFQNKDDIVEPIDFRIIARNGEVRWISHICQPVFGSDGRYMGRRASNRDITDRKLAENALQETTDYLENLIEYANAPIIVWDSNFRIARFNHAFERLTGLKANEILDNPLDILFPENGKEESLAYIRRTSSGERWETVEIPIKGIDGSVRTILWNSANIYNEKCSVVATIAQGQDITERKRIENELRKSKDELEQRVMERTVELQNAKEELECINEELRAQVEEQAKTQKELIQAKEAAEESVKAKSAFLANMSHELRTPMNAVIGFSSLLLDDNLTKDHREYIEGIRKGGEALLAIIGDILEFSRSEKDKIELEHQPFSLKHLIDESLDMVSTQSSKKGLNLSETVNYGTPDTIIGDHGRLRQILVNLLTNAVKFTDKGDVSVSVSSKALEGERHQIFFKVKDTGIGIPQDKINKIFEPFVQVERTLSRKRDGVGLGLAITKNLVELMEGVIWVESVLGQGTTFSFTIQAETFPGKKLDFGRMDSGPTSESFPELKPMRILVAEDNPSNQRVLVEMLKRLGYRADAVADGREVVQAFERQYYDLVLMDIKMPEMDGITATQVIRKLRPENGPKIVAITAFALEGDREKCLEAGMDDYIAKPVKMNELADILEKYSAQLENA
ncbi:MAG: PAS domain S-box protein [Methanotrichaceae archaeon]|jgi:PAS domain S-box-containing protein